MASARRRTLSMPLTLTSKHGCLPWNLRPLMMLGRCAFGSRTWTELPMPQRNSSQWICSASCSDVVVKPTSDAARGFTAHEAIGLEDAEEQVADDLGGDVRCEERRRNALLRSSMTVDPGPPCEVAELVPFAGPVREGHLDAASVSVAPERGCDRSGVRLQRSLDVDERDRRLAGHTPVADEVAEHAGVIGGTGSSDPNVPIRRGRATASPGVSSPASRQPLSVRTRWSGVTHSSVPSRK